MNPIATGYSPASATSLAGAASLKEKEKRYQKLAERHFVDGQIIQAIVDPATLSQPEGPQIVQFDSYRNASGATGAYLAAVAYKYGVTGEIDDLQRLERVLTGVYYMTTIASAQQVGSDPLAPRGLPTATGSKDLFNPVKFIDKDDENCKYFFIDNDGKKRAQGGKVPKPPQVCRTLIPTQRGVWVRSFAGGWSNKSDTGNVRSQARDESWGDYTWGFMGTLPGLANVAPDSLWGAPKRCTSAGVLCVPMNVYHFESEQSRDNVDWMLLGMAAAHEVLSMRRPDSPWLPRMAGVVKDFLVTLISNQYRLIDLDGSFPKWGHIIVWPKFDNPDDPGGDPSDMVEALGWLKVGIFMTNDAGLKAEYQRRVDAHIRGHSAASVFRAFDPLVGSFIRAFPEVVELGGPVPVYRPGLLMATLHPLIRYESDAQLRQFYVDYYKLILKPLTEPQRVPLFDAIQLVATGQPDATTAATDGSDESLRGRMAATLLQFRDQPFVKPTTPTSLQCQDDSLLAYTQYDTAACKLRLASPFYDWFVSTKNQYEALRKGEPKVPDLPLGDVNELAGGIWPLGPGVVPTLAEQWAAGATHALRGTLLQGDPRDDKPDKLYEPPGFDFLLQYWFARFHGLL
jgi:hypothetical protein